MSDPLPPAEWEEHLASGPRRAPEDEDPPAPEITDVTEAAVPDGSEGTAGHEGSGLPAREGSGPGERDDDRPPSPAPRFLPPAEHRRPLWRRPAGQRDDKGEPTNR